MAIEKKRMQQRYGSYAEFIAEKGRYLVGEFQAVRTGDPNSGTGRGLYMAFEPGVAEQLMTYENGKKLVDEATKEIQSQFTAGVEEAISDAESATESANLAAQDAVNAAEDATSAAQRAENISNSIESAVQGTLINDDSPSETTTFSGKHIDDDFLKKNGDVSDATVTFQQAVERANVESGDALDVAFGKLAKFCTDLKAHAFNAPANNLTTTQEGYALDARQGKALKDQLDKQNSALVDFRNAEALHIETITESKSYTLDKSISDYKLIEIIMQYGSSNWITTRLFRPSTLSQFPNIMDSAKTSLLECYYNMYINGKSVNIGAISNNTRILIRGIK